jgi:hypothetical protein
MKKSPAFAEADYLLPRISADFNGFLARPATYSTSLSTIKKILCHTVPPQELSTFTWHSLRVFMPHWAFVQGIDKSKRQYLGRWTNESTADIYVRSHRTMICDIWNQVTQGSYTPATSPVFVETGEPPKRDTILVDEDEPPPGASSPTHPSGTEDPISDTPSQTVRSLNFDTPSTEFSLVEAPTPATRESHRPHGDLIHADLVPPPKGPLTVAYSKRRTGNPSTHKVHLFTTAQVAIGCGWSPSSDQIQIMGDESIKSDMLQCCRCFSKHTYPTTWVELSTFPPDDKIQDDSDISSLSDTASSNDTDSEIDLRL